MSEQRRGPAYQAANKYLEDVAFYSGPDPSTPEHARKHLRAVMKEHRELGTKLAEAEAELNRYQSGRPDPKMIAAAEKIEQLDAKLSEAEVERDRLRIVRVRYEHALDNLEKQLDEVGAERDEAHRRLAEVEAERDRNRHIRRDVAMWKETAAKLEQQLAEAEAERDRIKQELDISAWWSGCSGGHRCGMTLMTNRLINLGRYIMQTHRDQDFMRMLQERAEKMEREGKSQITTGRPGEEAVQQFEHDGVQVVQLPDDPQGILRLSIGGGDHLPVAKPINYCNFRGDVGQCIALLEKCLAAMKKCE